MRPRPASVLALAAALGASLGGGLSCNAHRGPLPRTGSASGYEWVSTLHRDHPLAGRVLEVRSGEFVGVDALERAVSRADFVLLGETHDNVDHHLVQARLVRAVASAGGRPALAFEMLRADQQAAVDAALAAEPGSAEAVAGVWKTSGWPDFETYRPIFEAGLAKGLPLVAAEMPEGAVRAVVRQGRASLPEDVQEWLRLEEPIPPEVKEAMRREMEQSHCGALPEAMIEPLVLAQRSRDAYMARRLLGGAPGGRAILVAGSGHVRSDRGVPAYLRRAAPGRTVVSVGLLEVLPRAPEPRDYAAIFGADRLPFDYVVFTPAQEREDPCERLREQFRKHPPRPGGPAG
jgi:uncharacterized iron-regulated protein